MLKYKKFILILNFMTDNIQNNSENLNNQKDVANIEEKINKKAETWADKVAKFFDKIEFLDLDWEKKAEVATKVKQDATPDKLFRMEIFLSWVIASLGLLQNSAAVVIWAMLIAPFLRPMNGIWFAIARWERTFFWKPVKALIISIFISIFTWYVVSKLIGLEVETNEILARTSPNIIDLFIAIFSAMVAVLSLGFSRLSESIAWVAMAAALMPPLAVVGIELAFWNYMLAWGAMMLFLANLISIVLVATIFFWLYWFTPHSWFKQKSATKRFLFLITVILIISIPLIHSLILIKQKVKITKESNNYLSTILKQKTSDFTIDKLEVKSFSDDKIVLYAVIKIPEWLNFYDTFKKQLDFELSKKFGKKVELEVELIRVANIVSDENKLSLKDKMYNFIKDYFYKNYKDINLLSLDIEKDLNSWYVIKVIFWVKSDFNLDQFDRFKKDFLTKFNTIKVNFQFIPLKEYSKTKLDENDLKIKQVQQEVKKQFEEFIELNKMGDIEVSNMFVDYDLLTKKVKVFIDFNVEYKSIISFNNFLNKLLDFSKKLKNTSVETRVFIYKKYKFGDLENDKQSQETETGSIN